MFLINCIYSKYTVPKMILGFINKSNRGMRGMAMRVFSHVKEGLRLLMWCVCLPCVVMSIHKEYRAVITV